jgi:hypothetical protein
MPTAPPTFRPSFARDRSGYDADRRKALPYRRWYGTARWRARRDAQLAAEPDCRMCAAQGVARTATVADHVDPHRGDFNAFWFGELQSLCKTHHDREKQRLERLNTPRGGGNP